MSNQTIAPFGSWKSPITSDLIVAEMVTPGAVTPAGQDVYWVELRPQEGGRQVVVRRGAGGEIHDLTPPPFNARTRVHEYGGKPYLVVDETLYFSNFADQRLYLLAPGSPPLPLTPEADLRYADLQFDARRNRLICVREDHTRATPQAVNELVSLALGAPALIPGEVLVSGHDFYASPCLSPDGSRLAWLAWNHPNMPWDGTELWLGELLPDGTLGRKEMIAGGADESIFQPQWSPEGDLYFISDRSGWWNPCLWQAGRVEPLVALQAEFAEPQWLFGMSTYGFDGAGGMLCIYAQRGQSRLARIDLATKRLEEIATPYSDIWGLRVGEGWAYFNAGSPTEPNSLVRLELASGKSELLRRSTNLQIDPGYLSIPQEIEFPTEGRLTAYGFFYPPRNRDYAPPDSELPPLLVMSHGGPTGTTSTMLDLEKQYWTSRGIAVLDVNYGGSTGYGRAYRQRLNGQWGVVDVDDCANGARYLAERGLVDGERLAITGGSAGGYTTLCALTFKDLFKAGASHFGIGDLETFAGDTHKFESRYLDRLVGPYPERRDLYYQRSAINFTDRLNCPIILFQGLEDRIVPPSQSQAMYEAVRSKGLPVAYLAFEGEQHGFRKAENIKRSLDAELYFYSRVFGFELAEPVEPVPIDNL